jgi:hypothetical protein
MDRMAPRARLYSSWSCRRAPQLRPPGSSAGLAWTLSTRPGACSPRPSGPARRRGRRAPPAFSSGCNAPGHAAPFASGRFRWTARAMPPRMCPKGTGRRRRRVWSVSGASARGSPTGWPRISLPTLPPPPVNGSRSSAQDRRRVIVAGRRRDGVVPQLASPGRRRAGQSL